MSDEPTSGADCRQVLAEVFGAYKQERMNLDMFEHFITPGYFPELRTRTPCVMIGGRGTGKTTALWGLSYEGTYIRSGRNAGLLETSEIIGVYLRCDRAVSQTFSGSSRSAEDWQKLFIHYVNLVFCDLVLEFIDWAERELGDTIRLSSDSLEAVQLNLGLTSETIETTSRGLQKRLRTLITQLELAVNNNRPLADLQLSVLGKPLEPLVAAVSAATASIVHGKAIAFLLDEYESYSAEQQQVVNTLLKNSELDYTIKIAVRELGFHSRSVIGGGEPLIAPADFSVIDLSRLLIGSRFNSFAKDVIQARIDEYYRQTDTSNPPNTRILFPDLTISAEAGLLGASGIAADVRSEILDNTASSRVESFLASSTDLALVVLKYWAESDGIGLATAAERAAANSKKWESRLVNYAYASLFTLKSQRAAKIRKYYAGWDTLALMSAGNIRFLLLIVAEALRMSNENITAPELVPVTPEIQTLASQAVGSEHLLEIREIDQVGPDLLRLALGLGRLFETMARDPHGHTPEVNEFYLPPSDLEQMKAAQRAQLEDLLRAAVQHSVVLRIPSSKRRDVLTTREDDYLLHPILSAAFVFSHRRKRKVLVRPQELLDLVTDPRTALRAILTRTGRTGPPTTEFLPDQLDLFKDYFDAGIE
ncbi:MAG: hypothetical protein IPH29_04195 [Candidatus Microthrix sp.]|uniref:Uncharacterized protein n=1 Tax=Candidatus Neomicrothrix subdominans TaxID=2954438 RepID=A0A936TC20_9ACTN|nr:hypothetical protein [Candidatus Microthrix sp.]MBK9296006.1 hypothetical protein [Candidatus Microthrix subdominans]